MGFSSSLSDPPCHSTGPSLSLHRRNAAIASKSVTIKSVVVVTYIWAYNQFKVQARCPGHILQLSGLSVEGSELVGFVSLLVVS